jgi:hypothetical protein
MWTVWWQSCPEAICPQFNRESVPKKYVMNWTCQFGKTKMLSRNVRRSVRILSPLIFFFYFLSFSSQVSGWYLVFVTATSVHVLPISLFTYSWGAHISKKPRNHLKSPSVRRVTRRKSCTDNPQILGVTVQNLVARTTWSSGFVHPWLTLIILRCVAGDKVSLNKPEIKFYFYWSILNVLS